MRHLAEERGLDIEVDSCGTGGWHVGEAPDPRSVDVARRAGIDIHAQRARQLRARDLEEFDHVFAMDRSNLSGSQRLATSRTTANIQRLLDHHPEGAGPDVPDPYYGGPGGFDHVLALIMDSCGAFLDEKGAP